jgi:uncharacterized protein (DUF1330 family)
MNTKLQIMLAITAGVVIGAASVQGLHAQAKSKAYIVTENEVINAEAQKAYTPVVQAAQKAAGGRNLQTGGGKIVAFAGETPKRVAITEWDSLEAALAFRNGKAWKDLAPQRDKANKIHRAYAVEAVR